MALKSRTLKFGTFIVSGANDPRDVDIQKTSEELSDGLKACRSMLNDYRLALLAESSAQSGDCNALLKEWRTQEDSNL